jgi:RNA polymerase sigma-70 factor (ECF subfamily)
MRDLLGFSAEETCAVLHITDCNQRVLLHRARSRIRAELQRHLRQQDRRAPRDRSSRVATSRRRAAPLLVCGIAGPASR